MMSRPHPIPFLAGLLLFVMGAILLAEGLGWWDLRRSGLPYFVPLILILMGLTAIVSGLQRHIE